MGFVLSVVESVCRFGLAVAAMMYCTVLYLSIWVRGEAKTPLFKFLDRVFFSFKTDFKDAIEREIR